MAIEEGSAGLSNCYVFKSRLQEYAQKVGIPTPVYETIKEGPSHEPSFRSAVIINDVRYDSLPGFMNRKAAEQSAAEIALMELKKSGQIDDNVSQPLHETGLCKNLLQEYAQKLNYAVPVYQCRKEDIPGRTTMVSCVLDIGGIKYIGAAAKTKKEAEIKAARTALLAIQTNKPELNFSGDSKLTVIPTRKRPLETISNPEEKKKVKKAKSCKPKRSRKMQKKSSADITGQRQVENTNDLDAGRNQGQNGTSEVTETKINNETPVEDQLILHLVQNEAGSGPFGTETMTSDETRLDVKVNENESNGENDGSRSVGGDETIRKDVNPVIMSGANEPNSKDVNPLETGQCKSLLQNCAHKLNYADPRYQCQKEKIQGRCAMFSCVLDIGGIQYIGAAAKTKKEAEIKAARTALLAIQTINPELTVIPAGRKRPFETINNPEEKVENAKRRKPKKNKKKTSADITGQSLVENTNNIDAGQNQDQNGAPEVTDTKTKNEMPVGDQSGSNSVQNEAGPEPFGTETRTSNETKLDVKANENESNGETENDSSKSVGGETIWKDVNPVIMNGGVSSEVSNSSSTQITNSNVLAG